MKDIEKITKIVLPIQILLTIIILFLISLQIFCPYIKFDNVTIVLMLLLFLTWFWPFIKKIILELPGGGKITAESPYVKDTKESVEKLSPDKKAAIMDLEHRKQRLKEALDDITTDDPNLTLAALRVKLEKKLKELGKLYEIEKDMSLLSLLAVFEDKNILSKLEISVYERFIVVLNKAVHGFEIDSKTMDWALRLGSGLIKGLDKLIKGQRKKS